MTIEQTVNIPESRLVHLDLELPPEFPAGQTILTFRPASELKSKSNTPISDRLAGCCSNLGNLSLEDIRKERLSKHLK